LEDYLFEDYPEPPEAARQTILDVVRAEPGIQLSRLIGKGSGIRFEDVYALVGKRALYINLQDAPLAQPDRVKVYVDRVDALKCVTAALPAHDDARPRPTSISPPSGSIEIVDGSTTIESPTAEGEAILRGATEKELAEANRRYLILTGRASITEMKGSWQTHYRWRRAYREAEMRYGCGLIGLLTRYRFCGRKPGYAKEVVAIADQAITDHYFSAKAKTLIATYGVMALVCERQGLAVPSKDWLRRRISCRLARHEKTMRQQAAQPLISEERLLKQGNTAHGERPWDNAHVDHHLCDIELVCGETGLPLGRPWLSLMLDGFSRRVLAFVLSFDKPSYRALLLLMRECVHAYHRLPDSITVDGGPEFVHKSFDVLCARYNVVVKRYPTTRKEYGSIIDRLFGTLGTQFFQNLAGCTRPFRDGAVQSIQAAARKGAVWTLEEIHELLNDYFLQFHDNRLHPALSDTPRHAFEQGLERAGLRQTRRIVYDDNFVLMTLPTTTSGAAQVKHGIGVRINYIDYWCDEMRRENLVGVKVPVRYDPWNIAVAWVYLAGAWHRCVSVYAESFQGRSQKELMLASTIIVKKKAKVARDPLVTAKRLAEFFESAEAQEKLKRQQLKDRARSQTLKRAEREGKAALCYEI
jgi:hypothetical protein